MFLLIYVMVNIKTVILKLERRHGDVCNTDQCHHQQRSVTLQLTHQTDAASNYSHPALFVVDSLPQIL